MYLTHTLHAIVLTVYAVVICSANKRLMNHLLSMEYTPTLRPVLNEETTINVKIGMTLLQILELHEQEQYLQLNAWIHMHWKDELFTWDPKDFNESRRILMPHTKVWRPDVMLYNSVDEERSTVEILPSTNVLITHGGQVTWVAPALLKSSCAIDIRMYPFDTQWCNLTFGSWMHKSHQVNLVNKSSEAETRDFSDNGEWVLDSVTAERHELTYSCCPDSVTQVVFTIKITRRPLFYLLHLLFPCILLLLLGILVFCLPPESGEKVGLAITLLLSITVFMLVVMDYIPPTSQNISIFDQFFASAILLLSLAAGLAVMVTNLHYRGEHHARPPLWLSALLLHYLPKFVFMKNVTSRANISQLGHLLAGSDVGVSQKSRRSKLLSFAKFTFLRRQKKGDESSSSSSGSLYSGSGSYDSRSYNSKDMESHDEEGSRRSSSVASRHRHGPNAVESADISFTFPKDNDYRKVDSDNSQWSEENYDDIQPEGCFNTNNGLFEDNWNISNTAAPPLVRSSTIGRSSFDRNSSAEQSSANQQPSASNLPIIYHPTPINKQGSAKIVGPSMLSVHTADETITRRLTPNFTVSSTAWRAVMSSTSTPHGPNPDAVNILRAILYELKLVEMSRKAHTDLTSGSTAEVEWRMIAMVSDRVCLLLFTIITVGLTIFIVWPVGS